MRRKPIRTNVSSLSEVRQCLDQLNRHQPEWGGMIDLHTAAYTAQLGEQVLCDATLGGFTVTLPKTTGKNRGRAIAVKKVDGSANVVTIAIATGDTIDGGIGAALGAAYASMVFVSDPDRSQWIVQSAA